MDESVLEAMAQFEHNAALFMAALCLTLVAWFYGAPLWTQTFLLEGPSALNEGWSIDLFVALSGYEFLVSFVMGGGLAYFLHGPRALRWTIAFGIVLCLAHAAFSRPEVLDSDHWSDYAIVLAGITVPLVGAAFGGVLATSWRVRGNDDAVA